MILIVTCQLIKFVKLFNPSHGCATFGVYQTFTVGITDKAINVLVPFTIKTPQLKSITKLAYYPQSMDYIN